MDQSLQIRLEAESAHAIDDRPVVLPVAPAAPFDPPFLGQLEQGLVESEHGLNRGREAELPVRLEAPVLRQQVEAQAAGVAVGPQQGLFVSDHERKSRHAFDALVGRRDQVSDAGCFDVERHRPETAHGVYEELLAVASGQLTDGRHRIHDPGGGLTVNQRYHLKAGIALERFIDFSRIRNAVLRHV